MFGLGLMCIPNGHMWEFLCWLEEEIWVKDGGFASLDGVLIGACCVFNLLICFRSGVNVWLACLDFDLCV